MFRRICTILSITSLLIALTAAILWASSYSKPLHFSKETKTSIDSDRNFHRDFEFHSLDSGSISIGYVSAVVDVSGQRAEIALIRKRYPDVILNVFYGTRWLWESFQQHANPPDKTRAGFSFDYGSTKMQEPNLARLDGKWIRLSLPHWFPILLLSLPGLFHFRQNLKRTLRRRHALCPTCGYDLRESKSTCPECGSAAPSS